MKISPADLTTTVRSRSDFILTKIITGEGRQTITGRDRHNLLSDAMSEWKDVFNESQIKASIAYLRFLSRTKHDLMGDPGVSLQRYQKYCQVCHDVEDEADGIMTKLMGIMPIDHTNPNVTNSLDNEELVKSILDSICQPGVASSVRLMSRRWSVIFDCSPIEIDPLILTKTTV